MGRRRTSPARASPRKAELVAQCRARHDAGAPKIPGGCHRATVQKLKDFLSGDGAKRERSPPPRSPKRAVRSSVETRARADTVASPAKRAPSLPIRSDTKAGESPHSRTKSSSPAHKASGTLLKGGGFSRLDPALIAIGGKGFWRLLPLVPPKGRYTYDMENGRVNNTATGTSATLQLVGCSKSPLAIPPAASQKALQAFDRICEIISSEIMREIQAPRPAGRTRRRVFLLPSQLNSAEYMSPEHPVSMLAEYKGDNTGGPRGQLACDPAVAQFIIDNAKSTTQPHGVLDNLQNVLDPSVQNIEVKNGYLFAHECSKADAAAFQARLHKSTLLASMDVMSCGLDPDKKGTSKVVQPVDLLYGSAAPAEGSQYVRGSPTHPAAHRRVCQMLLFAQYLTAFKYAARRKPCELYLMPLGGGVFNNGPEDIAGAMALAYEHMINKINKGGKLIGVDVKLLTWDKNRGDTDERDLFANILKRRA